MTTRRVERRINSRITRRCSAFGSRRTVCSVVTMGIRNSRNKRQHMAARRPAENAELVLHTNHVHVRDVQKIRRPQIRGQVLLRDFEAHFRRIIVAALRGH